MINATTEKPNVYSRNKNNVASSMFQSFSLIPEKIAMINGNAEMSYAAFEHRVASIQQQLIEAGIVQGDVVGLLLHRDQWLIPSMIATFAMGATFVPLDSTYPRHRLERYVDVAKPKIILAHPKARHLANQLHKNVLSPTLGTTKSVLCAEVKNDDIAYILFTSGSTGQPKGVSISHGSLGNFLVSIAERLEVKPNHVFLAHTTIAFDISILELLLPLSVGGTVILANNEEVSDIEGIIPLIEKCHFVQATPSLWKILWATGWRPSPLTTVLSGGEALPISLATNLNKTCKRLWNLYGPTEATIWTSCECVDKNALAISIGVPLENTDLHVLDEDLRPSNRGELYISGKGLAQGYYGNEEGTSKAFIIHPHTGIRLYRSGDSVHILEDGKIEWQSRGEGEIKIRGNRIGVKEIESALENINDVSGAIVGAHAFEGHGDDMLTAYIVSQVPQSKISLENSLRKNLPEYMIPDIFMVLPNIPLQPNGKLDKKSLPIPNRNNTLQNSENKVQSVPIDSESQAIVNVICEVFATMLGQAKFNETSSFFDLGGNSALAVISAAMIGAKIEKKLPVIFIVKLETPNAIATKILQELT